MIRSALLVSALAAAAVLARLAFKDTAADAHASQAVPAVSVSLGTATVGDMALGFEAAGRAEAKASVQLKSRVDGQVAEVAFQEGQSVHKGQLMYRLDPAVYQTAARQAEGTLARDQAQLVKLRSDADRNEALFRQGFIAESVLTQSRADLNAMQASLTTDRAALDNARLQLGYCNIVAPYDGVAGATQLPLGGAAQANVTTLVVINQVDPINVSFPVPEARLESLKAALHRGAVRVTARAQGGERVFAGALSFIDNGVDAASGSILAKALIDNRDHALTPGQFLAVTVQVDELRQVLSVPSAAVESGVDGPYAFVLAHDTRVALRRLKVGAAAGGRTVVLEGLQPGEHVVTSGQSRLRDGDAVNIDAAPKVSP
ncbi:MAG: efflux RND transporter periplasmic adaptor subunit [Paucibacter sp.]|nr:efflux RND transporter periplasmic adaptor subunit [Roseateles sp.]